jgi:hypothetical protein
MMPAVEELVPVQRVALLHDADKSTVTNVVFAAIVEVF